MNGFDEKQPEENDPKYEELLTLLEHANLDALFVDPQDQAQALSQVRARLFPPNQEVTQHDTHEMPELGTFPSKPKAQGGKSGRLVHLLNVIAAVLVVVLLIGSTLLFFGPLLRDRFGIAPSKGTFGAPRKVGTLVMRLNITPGPYFLNELLEVDVLITNPTSTTYSLTPKGLVDPLCNQLLNIVTTDGGGPHALDFQHYWDPILRPPRNCSPLSNSVSLFMGISVSAHQTFTYKQYVQLTSSGHVTLTAKLVSLWVDTWTRTGTGTSTHTSTSTFAGALDDTLDLFVSPYVPSDRQLAVQEQKTQVVVSGPPAVNGQLIGKVGSVCPDPGGGQRIDGLTPPPGATVVVKPVSVACGANGPKPLWWTYVVGAPGYSLVSGRVNG